MTEIETDLGIVQNDIETIDQAPQMLGYNNLDRQIEELVDLVRN
jgi:hypothetical protein